MGKTLRTHIVVGAEALLIIFIGFQTRSLWTIFSGVLIGLLLYQQLIDWQNITRGFMSTKASRSDMMFRGAIALVIFIGAVLMGIQDWLWVFPIVLCLYFIDIFNINPPHQP